MKIDSKNIYSVVGMVQFVEEFFVTGYLMMEQYTVHSNIICKSAQQEFLSNDEKVKIVEMLYKGKSAEIAKTLARDPHIIKSL